MRRGELALGIAIVGVLIHAPRLAKAFMAADGIDFPHAVEYWYLLATGVGTAAVVSGGCAYLTHELARGGRHQALVLSCWVLEQIFLLVLLAPMLVLGIRRAGLAAVLFESTSIRHGFEWTSAVVAVLSIEVMVAGSMLARGRGQSTAEELEALRNELDTVAGERNRVQAALDRMHERSAGHEGQVHSAGSTRRSTRASNAGRVHSGEHGEPVQCTRGCGRSFQSARAERAHRRFCTVQDAP